MKNKQHEYILKAFLETNIPIAIRRNSSNLILLDSVIGGYCTQLINNIKHIDVESDLIISKEEKKCISALINEVTGREKDEIIVYYRIMILVESILIQYQKTKD